MRNQNAIRKLGSLSLDTSSKANRNNLIPSGFFPCGQSILIGIGWIRVFQLQYEKYELQGWSFRLTFLIPALEQSDSDLILIVVW